ncbi:hypothetical protein [Pseudobutyrivibrio xylanivorans]|uniref:Uncharacterized protein n=1 Tax=Pseudobutyrivibrio xylanivorans TaxID=185007 RepID=A0A5P6VLE1_PSEXY|nr:hypothetical protein [Pseudobutyrivibrio xylanivorans]QFJ53388.1 hypothetical protein FXF36_00120 [Pseudobutyrivibrio xylanivorans]QFJ53465.1 hypothetical protein FXF36_00530 [Pseudobutyrivibrio xylanivorans]
MKQRLIVNITFSLLISIFSLAYFIKPTPVFAESLNIDGVEYQFDEDTDYVLKNAQSNKAINGKTKFGILSLDGDIKKINDVNKVQAFEVNSGIVEIKYNIDTATDKISEDNTKKVSTATLDEKVKKGAIIVQTSLDGENWFIDKQLTDVLGEESEFEEKVYESNYVQQANGCFYRVLVAYKTKTLVEKNSFLVFDTSDYNVTRWAEVYKFYLIDKDLGNVESVDTTPRTIFQDKEYRFKVENDSGYSVIVDIPDDDPHRGWNLGDFTINGYTDAIKDEDDVPMFLKNVGDQVTLWFTLDSGIKDINKLNGNEDLSINDVKDGWDDQFDIKHTAFRKGTLIIQQTDAEGKAKDPVVFTNYLEANVRTGADTKVKLFEEGDYVVALDYEIKDSSGILDDISSYSLFFEFKIRNGNCNIFPFDLATNNQLVDHSISMEGFRLDYANSKYLTVSVEHKAINFNGTSYSEDTKGNKPAKDGSEYKDEGIYIISVEHDYDSNRKTDKTIYVGDSPIIKALSKNNLSVNDVNNLLAQGYKLKDDGSLVSKSGEAVTEDENIEDANDTTEVVDNSSSTEIAKNVTEKSEPDKSDGSSGSSVNSTKQESSPIGYIGIAVVIVVGGFWVLKNRKKKLVQNINETNEGTRNEERGNVDVSEEEEK